MGPKYLIFTRWDFLLFSQVSPSKKTAVETKLMMKNSKRSDVGTSSFFISASLSPVLPAVPVFPSAEAEGRRPLRDTLSSPNNADVQAPGCCPPLPFSAEL